MWQEKNAFCPTSRTIYFAAGILLVVIFESYQFAGGSKVNTGDADKENPDAGTGSAG
ncbi:hypothetical protein [Heyndrickxia coagulans]|uniref:hypothetical protein n=1 Tax=Heyndrickxia coagulans TaxID=1398 RepID=UPI0021648E2F|nr:hypothetical protein [Heyndrickxia coagulans]